MPQVRPRRPALAALMLAAVAVAVAARPASAQIPDEFTNLKVLPKDISKADLTNIMRGFAGGLGVRCNHCHEGEDMRTMDFASDKKETKQAARLMLEMVNSINTGTLAKLGEHGHSPDPVTCLTCHRGRRTPPRPLDELLTNTARTAGVDAAIAEYKQLKEKDGDAGFYDFRLPTLVSVARALREDKKPAEGVAFLRKVTEMFPKSADAAAALGGALAETGDTAGAQAEFERALAIDPEHGQARSGLQRLKGGAGGPGGPGAPPRPQRP